MLEGLKLAVIPAVEVAERATAPVKPFCGLIVIVEVAEVPCVIVRLDGLELREKLGGGAVETVMLATALVLVLWVGSPA